MDVSHVRTLLPEIIEALDATHWPEGTVLNRLYYEGRSLREVAEELGFKSHRSVIVVKRRALRRIRGLVE